MSQDHLLVEHEPLREWLRTRKQTNQLLLLLMALRYDLDGAVEAQQPGLAWRSLEELISVGTHLFLTRAGVEVPHDPNDDRVDRVFRVLSALERVQPDLSAEVWQLLLRPPPEAGDLPREIDRTLAFVQTRLDLPCLVSRRDTVLEWASDTRLLRSMAEKFGIAESDDWYLSASGTDRPGQDWYGEVIESLEREVST